VDAAGHFLVDLQDLPHLAVLPVGGLRTGIFQRQTVLVDPLVRGTSFAPGATSSSMRTSPGPML
jgi:hypothetical protein